MTSRTCRRSNDRHCVFFNGTESCGKKNEFPQREPLPIVSFHAVIASQLTVDKLAISLAESVTLSENSGLGATIDVILIGLT